MNVDEFVTGKKPVNPLLANPRSRVIPENVASSSQKKTFKTFKMYLSKTKYRQHDALNLGFVNTKKCLTIHLLALCKFNSCANCKKYI